MSDLTAYVSLFFSALLSATILPGTSEAAMVLLLNEGQGLPVLLFTVAVIGNVLGSVVNWILGRYFTHFKDRKWFPLKEKQYDRAVGWFDHYGKWTLLLSWAPFFGDPLTIVAGAMRVHFGFFLLLVTLGKAARYLFVVQAALAVLE
ncbi:YqaA family protein [Sneathiella sp. HT1-7]|uniref:YqaA family protein n=1 Tax=Sneathiella sp. HT1-7 TaxID=2887192 RepID=UPI001D132D7B|nr:YqaA family protein [Sneathiella sp. HT1-7]MCC3305861.1 DedA family protein [Sneathiella sp. HT1-7]